MLQSLITALICLVSISNAFIYLVLHQPIIKGDTIPLYVNHLTPSFHHSSKQGKTATYVYSYDYYYPKFHFCTPKGGAKKQLESLGSIIFGDRIFNSPFEIKMLETKSCQSLCTSKYSKSDSVFVNRNIRAGYTHNWIVDGLPASMILYDATTSTELYGSGFRIGKVDNENKVEFYNHFEITIEYHKRKEDEYRVVGVTVSPASLDRSELKEDVNGDQLCSLDLKPVQLSKNKETEVLFTYTVNFKKVMLHGPLDGINIYMFIIPRFNGFIN